MCLLRGTDWTFNIHKFYVLPTQLYLCVLCGSENKQRLFPYTTLTDWFVLPRRGVFTARYGLNIWLQFRLIFVLKCLKILCMCYRKQNQCHRYKDHVVKGNNLFELWDSIRTHTVWAKCFYILQVFCLFVCLYVRKYFLFSISHRSKKW